MTIILLILLAALPAGASEPRKLIHAGEGRTYLLHIPKGLKTPAPIVVVLHGGGGRGRGMERLSGFSRLADEEGFIAAYPDGLGRNWYDGREGDISDAHRLKRDDAGFIEAMLDAISLEHPVDPKRVYATGISNGAFFSHYLAAVLPGRFAAIAPVVGGLADPFHKVFNPLRPVSVLMIQGTRDPLVPYKGGDVARKRGRLIPTEEAARLWAKANGCQGSPQEEILPDQDPEDGCLLKRRVWQGCKAGGAVELLVMEGAGHTWPSGFQYLPKRVIGRVCRELDSSTLWRFFKGHPRP
ncbi:MAG: PHB depolymerase family esterase [Elusimicrobiota bacterium]